VRPRVTCAILLVSGQAFQANLSRTKRPTRSCLA